MTEHPTPDALADLDAELPVAAEVTTHLATCADCTADLEQIRSITRLLAELPAEPIPNDVADRVDAALAAERAAISAPATVVPFQSRSRRAIPSWVAAAAAAVVLFGGGALVVSNLGGGDPSPSPLSATNNLNKREVVRATGSDYRAATLAAQLPTLLGGAQALDSAGGGGTVSGYAGTPTPEAAEAPAATGSAAGGAVGGAVDQPKAADPSALFQARAAQDQLLTALHNPTALAACLVRALGADVGDPLAVDLARFNGEPAVIVAVPALGRSDKVDIYVLDPGCPEGLFVYFARLPLPQPR